MHSRHLNHRRWKIPLFVVMLVFALTAAWAVPTAGGVETNEADILSDMEPGNFSHETCDFLARVDFDLAALDFDSTGWGNTYDDVAITHTGSVYDFDGPVYDGSSGNFDGSLDRVELLDEGWNVFATTDKISAVMENTFDGDTSWSNTFNNGVNANLRPVGLDLRRHEVSDQVAAS
jgi:hypothetical protein